MFGYVTPLKAEMKVKDFNRFKCYYCGLCCHIKKQFGNIPRISLNYDMTFLGLLLDALNPDEIKVSSHVCLLHPTEKKIVISENKALSYAAAINISLFYYKLVDDVNDDKNIRSKISALLLSPYRRKFSSTMSSIDNKIKAFLDDLSDLESNKNFYSIDEICDPFSKLVATILKDYPYELIDDSSELRDNLYELGYSLGKWIYLIDALDDLSKDIENNNFNPINYVYNKDNTGYSEFVKEIKPRIEFMILNCGYTCKEKLSQLKLNRNVDILYNIIELGLIDKYLNIINNCSENKKKKKGEISNEPI